MSRKVVPGVVGVALFLSLAVSNSASAQNAEGWPSLKQQIARAEAPAGSALERLIRENQDFSLLRPDEAFDKVRIPLWLRVHWRKSHPDLEYSPLDPAGGYPLVLKEVAEWMEHHPDLQPGRPEPDVAPRPVKVSGGTNLRISGASAVSRSESDIRVNYWNPQRIIGGSNNIGGSGRQAQFYSTDGGATWGQTSLPLQPGDAFHSDPTVDWTSNGTAWATTIGINSAGTVLKLQVYKSTNQGATWVWDATASSSQSNVDKPMIWVDHSATSAFKDNLYACWHNGTPQFVNRRTSAGWGTPLQISGTETTGTAIGCDVKTNSNGDVFVFWPSIGNRRLLVAKSTNGGASYGKPVMIGTTFDSFDIGVPSFQGRRALIYTSGGAYKTATKDMVYAAWTDLTGATGCTSATHEPDSNAASACKSRIWFARSANGGATWSAPVMINNQASLNDQFNQSLVVDETNGQIAVIYYDTAADPARRKTHVYYQASFDDGATWSTPFRVTTAQTDETIAGADSGNQYGDYNSLSGYAGTFFPSWTDRRGGTEEIWTAALTEGPPCTPPPAPTGLTATASGSTGANLSWTAVSGATSYRIYRATTSDGPYTLAGTSATTSFADSGLACNTGFFYVVRAVAGCESANSNQAPVTTGACTCTQKTLYTSNGFESSTGMAGWAKGSFVSGGNTADWRGVQACTAHGGTKVLRFGGINCAGDYGNNRFTYAQPGGVAGIAIPPGANTARLAFWHRRAFQTGSDGGTLAISVNGGKYFFVPASAILSGSTYNGTTSKACPPKGGGGISVFTGTQASFVRTVINLDAACNAATGGTSGCAGKSVRIGFTSITDCAGTADGWFLDDVTVTACAP